MGKNTQHALDSSANLADDRLNVPLQKRNPLKESGDSGVWRLHDEDGSDTGIIISKECITTPSLEAAPIMVIWENEKNLEIEAMYQKEYRGISPSIMTKGTLHRLIDSGENDDREGSQSEPKKVLIYRSNPKFWSKDGWLIDEYIRKFGPGSQ